ncbi:MAG: hypothetical protein ABI846_11515 [Rudaea sp.]
MTRKLLMLFTACLAMPVCAPALAGPSPEMERFGNFYGNPQDLAQAANLLKTVQAAADLYKALTAIDERMNPNYEPAGAPDVPSQCMENDECKVCYGHAQERLNTTRKGLEKLRGITLYTQAMAKQGENFISAVGNTGGTVTAMQAVATNQDVDKTVSDFNSAVRSKREELLGKVKGELQEISACEKQFYKNDDWYNRYGFMYYQFMLAQYANLP